MGLDGNDGVEDRKAKLDTITQDSLLNLSWCISVSGLIYGLVSTRAAARKSTVVRQVRSQGFIETRKKG